MTWNWLTINFSSCFSLNQNTFYKICQLGSIQKKILFVDINKQKLMSFISRRNVVLSWYRKVFDRNGIQKYSIIFTTPYRIWIILFLFNSFLLTGLIHLLMLLTCSGCLTTKKGLILANGPRETLCTRRNL